MDRTSVQRVAGTLRAMVSLVMVCNIIALFFVPAVMLLWPEPFITGIEERLLHLLQIAPLGEDDIYIPMFFVALTAWGEVFRNPVLALYTLGALLCGGCTFCILFQARTILNTILQGQPFQMVNALSLKKAAVSCWIISGTALLRLMAELAWLRTTAPLYQYNTLFILLFLMAGLLFMVMSALFCQAAQLQEEQDLTI